LNVKPVGASRDREAIKGKHDFEIC